MFKSAPRDSRYLLKSKEFVGSEKTSLNGIEKNVELCVVRELVVVIRNRVHGLAIVATLRLLSFTLFTGSSHPCLPPPPFPFLFLPPPLPLFFSSYHPGPCHSLEVGPLNTARGSVERCKLPRRGLRWIPSGNRIRCILALKTDVWRH